MKEHLDVEDIKINDDGEGSFTSVEVCVEIDFRTDSVTISGYGKDEEMAAKNLMGELIRFKGRAKRTTLQAICIVDDHEDIPNLEEWKEKELF